MQAKSERKTYPEPARAEMALGRCLVEGDPEATSRARRARGKTFGMSLAIEFLFVGLLVVVPLLTSVAQPQIHKILPPQLAYFGAWRQHSPAQNAAPPTTARMSVIPNPFLRATPPRVPVYIPGGVEQGDIAIPDLPGGYEQGGSKWLRRGGRLCSWSLRTSRNRRNKRNVS
jgi:hypothetical protein